MMRGHVVPHQTRGQRVVTGDGDCATYIVHIHTHGVSHMSTLSNVHVLKDNYRYIKLINYVTGLMTVACYILM